MLLDASLTSAEDPAATARELEERGYAGVVADPDDAGAAPLARFDGLVDRFSIYPGTGVPTQVWDPVVRALA